MSGIVSKNGGRSSGIVGAGDVGADAVDGSNIADDAIDSEHYADVSIDAAHIASNAVTTAKINADAVTGAKIADDAIDSEHYADGSIDNAHIADDALGAEHYAAGSVDATALGADCVTAAKIGDNVLNSEHYAAASIDNEHLADDAVGVAELSATGTASSSTFLRGDNSWATAGGGKVLQVVQNAKTDTGSTTSTSYSTMGGTVTITPATTSSKILISWDIVMGATMVGGVYIKLQRTTTDIYEGDASGSGHERVTYNNDSNAWNIYSQWMQSGCYLDSPSTTSATTYKLVWKVSSGSTFYINRSSADRTSWSPGEGRSASSITAIEIGA